MNESARLKKNEYMKAWRAKNKDKVKAAQDRYWEKKALADECASKDGEVINT